MLTVLDDAAFDDSGEGGKETVIFDEFVEEVEFGLFLGVLVGEFFEWEFLFGLEGFMFFLYVFHI